MAASAAPRVSVCIPTYNYAAFVGQAIESVLAQTFTDFELIVVDDASQDDTANVVERYLNDPRVRFIRNETNRGLFANFNYCAELARGEFLKFLCADDWLEPRFLERCVAVLDRHGGVGIVTTSDYQVDDDGRRWGLEYSPFTDEAATEGREGVEWMAGWQNVVGMPSNVVLRRSAFDEAGGFDGAFAPAADAHLWLKIMQRHQVAGIREPLCSIRVHQSKSHRYGTDPTEAIFLIWEDAAIWPGTNVSRKTLALATYREARRCTLHVLVELAGRNWRDARRIWGFIGRHVDRRRFVPRFVLDVPLLSYWIAKIVLAKRLGRYAVRDRAPRIGPPAPAGRD